MDTVSQHVDNPNAFWVLVNINTGLQYLAEPKIIRLHPQMSFGVVKQEVARATSLNMADFVMAVYWPSPYPVKINPTKLVEDNTLMILSVMKETHHHYMCVHHYAGLLKKRDTAIGQAPTMPTWAV